MADSPVSRLSPADLAEALPGLPGVDHHVAGALTLAVQAPDFAAAVRLIGLIARAAEEQDHHPDLDLRGNTVFLALSTHSAGGVTTRDLDLARSVLAAADLVDGVVLPAPERVEIALDCVDADAVRPFWRAGLGYQEWASADGQRELHDPLGRGPVLWFQAMDPPRTERGRLHLDVYLPDVAAARQRLAETLAAGGRLVTDAHAPSWWVVADAEGNELCLCTREPAPRAS